MSFHLAQTALALHVSLEITLFALKEEKTKLSQLAKQLSKSQFAAKRHLQLREDASLGLQDRLCVALTNKMETLLWYAMNKDGALTKT